MEMYSVERWILDRHDEATRDADERARLEGWPMTVRTTDRVAMLLRRLADRIDGRHWAPHIVGSSPRADRGPREIADFVGWDGARGEGTRVFIHPASGSQ